MSLETTDVLRVGMNLVSYQNTNARVSAGNTQIKTSRLGKLFRCKQIKIIHLIIDATFAITWFGILHYLNFDEILHTARRHVFQQEQFSFNRCLGDQN